MSAVRRTVSGRNAVKQGWARRRWVWVVVVAAASAAGWVLFERVHAWRLHALFVGSTVVSPGPPEGFTSQIHYDFTKYREGADAVPASSGDAWHGDAATGASRIVRVSAPSAYKERLRAEFLTVNYPPDGAVFPPNLCAPFFEWTDVYNDLWQVTLAVRDKELVWTLLSYERRWRVPPDVWDRIVRRAGDAEVTLVIKGVKRRGVWGKARESVHVSQTVRFRISADSVDNAIVYRLVDPPFINLKTPDTFVRDVRQLRPRPFLKARRQYCINCHNFSSKSGDTGKLGIQVRYVGRTPFEHTVYLAVCDLQTRRIIKTLLPFQLQMTTFMSWSPDGRKLAVSANQQLFSVQPYVQEAQNTQQSSSDVAMVDLDAGTSLLLQGACDNGMLETFPRWTPDGSHIIFCKAPQKLHPRLTKYSLMSIPYNDGRGGEPRVLIDANGENGRSNYYPRFSPDGKWFSFVQSDFGSLIKSSSDIILLAADKLMQPDPEKHLKPLRSNAQNAADSWYSWSSNSRWIVFATKRDDGVYARLYMTHIDDEGNASPAVRLPLAKVPLMSFNIPEFVANVPPIDERTLFAGVRVERDAVRIRRTEGVPHE